MPRLKPQQTDETDAEYARRVAQRERQRAYMLEWTRKNAERLREPRKARTKERRETVPGVADAFRRRSREKAARRAAEIAALKHGKSCMDCGGVFHPCAMDWDHRDPSTKDRRFKGVGMMGSRTSWKNVVAEIEKCDLVCANCHRIRTHVSRKRVC